MKLASVFLASSLMLGCATTPEPRYGESGYLHATQYSHYDSDDIGGVLIATVWWFLEGFYDSL